jgi:hypothetical protein
MALSLLALSNSPISAFEAKRLHVKKGKEVLLFYIKKKNVKE